MTISLDSSMIKKAILSLLKFDDSIKEDKNKKADKKNLFTNEFNLDIVFILKNPAVKEINIPIQINITNSLYNHSDIDICYISQDPQKNFDKLVEEQPVDRLSEVIGFTKLMKNYKQYEDKRELCNRYALFLADKNIITKLMTAFRQPAPIDPTPEALAAARDSTFLTISQGRTFSVVVGSHNLNADQIVQNIMDAVPAVLNYIDGGLSNVAEIGVHIGDSPCVPFYHYAYAGKVVAPKVTKGKKAEEVPLPPVAATPAPVVKETKAATAKRMKAEAAAKAEVESESEEETEVPVKKTATKRKAEVEISVKEVKEKKSTTRAVVEKPKDDKVKKAKTK